eukprot:5684326-Pleurochrysis_carterae.AAC.1
MGAQIVSAEPSQILFDGRKVFASGTCSKWHCGCSGYSEWLCGSPWTYRRVRPSALKLLCIAAPSAPRGPALMPRPPR